MGGVNCYHFVSKDTSYFQHNCCLSWPLCVTVNDVLSCLCVKARVLFVWGEEQVVVDLPIGSDKAGVDSSLMRELLVFKSPSLCLMGVIQFNLQTSQGMHSPCWCSALCVFGRATHAAWGERMMWLEGK